MANNTIARRYSSVIVQLAKTMRIDQAMPCIFATCSRQRCTKWVLDKHRCWGCKSGMTSGVSSLRPSNCIPMRKHQHLHPHRHESGRFIMYAAPQNPVFLFGNVNKSLELGLLVWSSFFGYPLWITWIAPPSTAFVSALASKASKARAACQRIQFLQNKETAQKVAKEFTIRTLSVSSV